MNAISFARKLSVIAHQQLVNLDAVIGKETGVRTIAETPMLWRVDAKLDNKVQAWEDENIGSYGTAAKES